MNGAESHHTAAKEAAAKEREERLNAARKKVRSGEFESVETLVDPFCARKQLKTYRARQPKNSSVASTADSTVSNDSTIHSKRSSVISHAPSGSSSHQHRRSISRNLVNPPPVSPAKGHGRKASKSRASAGGHNHTRSRASVSISTSTPNTATPFTHHFDVEPVVASFSSPTRPEVSRTGLGAPMSWQANGSFPSSPEAPSIAKEEPPSTHFDAFSSSQSAANLLFAEAIEHASRAARPQSIHTPTRSVSNAQAGPSHNRRASRHNRQSSVSNFRESIEIMSGTGTYLGGLQPGVSSFAGTAGSDHTLSPLPSAHSSEGSPTATNWTDPARVLEILKERGRKESLAEKDPVRTRQGALEALEGRVAAPSETIDLGGIEDDDAASDTTPASTSPTLSFSPSMIGLGLSGNPKRNSWGTPGPITTAGAKGAMDLGMLMEEEEEDDEDVTPNSSAGPKRRSAGKRRPTTLVIPSPAIETAVAVADTPLSTSTFSARPMRLSLTLSSSVNGSFSGTPSTSTTASPTRAPVATRPPTSPPKSPEFSAASAEKRRHSLFHSAAAISANARTERVSSTPPSASRGLRSLSIGTLAKQSSPSTSASPATPARSRSPIPGRRASSATPSSAISNPPAPRGATSVKRSSISYLTSPAAAPASPEGPPSAQGSRGRPWRTNSSTSPSPSAVGAAPAPIPSGTLAGYAFPFAPSHGNFGGFGELEVADEEGPTSPSNRSFAGAISPPSISEDPKILSMQIVALRNQIDQLKNQAVSATSMHALEIAEYEKKAGEEARGMRMRISEIERQLEEGRVGRRFEVEGLSREIEQAREAMTDLTEERDSLVEDVEGWRSRCAALELIVKKDREDEALAVAQAKLSGEMRDQIYNLVAALERERAEHNETHREVERLLVENASLPPREEEEDNEQAAIGSRGHELKASDDSFPSMSSSFGRSFSGTTEATSNGATDLDDYANKPSSSPPSGHSSFIGSKGRDSDFGGSVALGGLQTLAEEDEEEEEQSTASKREESERRLGSGSTDSTDNSDVMPMTPTKEAPASHHRSDSFVRHWSVSSRFCFACIDLRLIAILACSSRKVE